MGSVLDEWPNGNNKATMKTVAAILLLAACVAADVSHIVRSGEYDAPILKSNSDISPEGNYQYEYETGNGIAGQEQGHVINAGSENAAISVQGSNRYTAPDGQQIQLTYVADENGYQPQGAHLPVGPAIPEYILRSLEYIRTHPPAKEYEQKQNIYRN